MSKKMKIALIVLVILVIAGVSYWYFVMKPKKDAKKTTTVKKDAADPGATKTERIVQTATGDTIS